MQRIPEFSESCHALSLSGTGTGVRESCLFFMDISYAFCSLHYITSILFTIVFLYLCVFVCVIYLFR